MDTKSIADIDEELAEVLTATEHLQAQIEVLQAAGRELMDLDQRLRAERRLLVQEPDRPEWYKLGLS